jgi:hypothetical protein
MKEESMQMLKGWNLMKHVRAGVVLMAAAITAVWLLAGGRTVVSTAADNEMGSEPVLAHLDLTAYGYEPLAIPDRVGEMAGAEKGTGEGSQTAITGPAVPYATIRKSGPTAVQPGSVVGYQVQLANYEAISHTYQLTIPLPAGLTYQPNETNTLTYDPAGHLLHWQGTLPPGHLDYDLATSGLNLPYLDLADFGLPNLCEPFFEQEEACAGVNVTFNLGVNGRQVNLYGQSYYQLTVSTDGQLLVGDGVWSMEAGPHWLPDTAVPGLRLAGLWRPADLGHPDSDANSGANGRWHAAIISGLIDGHDLFYAQWHNTPSATNPNLTARHAVALVVDGGTNASPLSGHIFYIYDNISDPDQMAAAGYTIGISDALGRRGLTYAYAPGSTGSQPPQGQPPAAGTTLHLRPSLWSSDNDYRRTFSYRAIVNGPVPSHIVTTAYATPADPALPTRWASHYLALRYQAFLPLVTTSNSQLEGATR